LLVTRAAIFDLDDTLYSHDEFVAGGFAAVGEYVASLDHAGVAEVCGLLWRFRDGPERGRELQALCAAFELSPALVPRLLHVFRAHRPRLSLAHGAADTLRELRARGWRLGILTNGLSAVQRRKVHALGVEALVDTVVYAEEHAAGGKPAAAAFDAAARGLGVAHPRVVMVGNDLECDVCGAERAGLRAIQVRAASYRNVPSAEAPDAADLIDVPALAERLIPARADVH
jgi:putative hydrolase of the HAD superfamily